MSTKILFIGPRGIGKTTAIATLSGKPPTKVRLGSLDEESAAGPERATEFNYGMLCDNDAEDPTFLLSVPAFRHLGAKVFEVWPHGVVGALLLLDHLSTTATRDMQAYLEEYAALARRNALVVGVVNIPATSGVRALEPYVYVMESMGLTLPLAPISVTTRTDLLWALDALVANAEMEVAHAPCDTDFGDYID
jgi:uncharacterized protein